jgi:hypothetical protein
MLTTWLDYTYNKISNFRRILDLQKKCIDSTDTSPTNLISLHITFYIYIVQIKQMLKLMKQH